MLFLGYPGFGGFGLLGFELLLEPIEGFLLGLGLGLGNGLANLGGLLAGGGLGSYGYGFGGSYYCLDYLPGCYQVIRTLILKNEYKSLVHSLLLLSVELLLFVYGPLLCSNMRLVLY